MSLFKKKQNNVEQNMQERDYPTKEEYLQNIDDIRKKELASQRFFETKKFIENFRNRKYQKEEKELFSMIGSYSLKDEEYLLGKPYNKQKDFRLKKFKKLNDFIDSLPKEAFDDNIYFKLTKIFMIKSSDDCKAIAHDIVNEIEENKVTYNMVFPVSKDLKQYILKYLPTKAPVLYYKPASYKLDMVDIIVGENKEIYEEYNDFVSTIRKLLSDIYKLQVWNLLSTNSREINVFNFSEHCTTIPRFAVNFSVAPKKEIDKEIVPSKIEEDIVTFVDEENQKVYDVKIINSRQLNEDEIFEDKPKMKVKKIGN